MKKKYLTAPVIAALIGVGLAGVAKAHLNARVHFEDLYSFKYNPSSTSNPPYSITEVEKLSNWEYTTTDQGCDGTDEKACEIHVKSSDVVPSGNTYVLNPNFSITATESVPDVSYVEATTDGSQDPTYITNRIDE